MDSVSSEIVKYGKRSKGFGFVTYATKEEAAKAIETLDTKELDGRPVTVKLSRPKTEKPAVRIRKIP
jgi:RNA recognition motif-containing protein